MGLFSCSDIGFVVLCLNWLLKLVEGKALLGIVLMLFLCLCLFLYESILDV